VYTYTYTYTLYHNIHLGESRLHITEHQADVLIQLQGLLRKKEKRKKEKEKRKKKKEKESMSDAVVEL